MSEPQVTLENVAHILQHDSMVKVAGVDVDGQLRGKLMAKKKFLSVLTEGFGFCSVVFGWDMHDQTYFKELGISNKENGYRDIVAVPDLSSFRRTPWEGDVPFFLVSFFDPDTREPVCACPRGLLKTMLSKAEAAGYRAMAGGMLSPHMLIWTESDCHSGIRVPSVPCTWKSSHPGAQCNGDCHISQREPRRGASSVDRGNVWI